MTARPLLSIVKAEQRIKRPEPRDFRADPWKTGEGVTFFTEERVLQMKRDNEALRQERRRRK